MRIAVTGGSGGIGRAVIARGVEEGHGFVNLDVVPPRADSAAAHVPFVKGSTTDYPTVLSTLRGCDAVIHLAAIGGRQHADHAVHRDNVCGSYNVLRAAAELGIARVCQASSVNAVGHAFSRAPRYDYFPIDEAHPTYNEDPYSLSKWLAEQQADSIARRHPAMSIASLRFHWVVDDAAVAARDYLANPAGARTLLYAYTLTAAAVRACLRALVAPFRGHEVMFVVAPETLADVPTRELAHALHPQAELRGALPGRCSLFDSSKAGRVLGWRHDDA